MAENWVACVSVEAKSREHSCDEEVDWLALARDSETKLLESVLDELQDQLLSEG